MKRKFLGLGAVAACMLALGGTALAAPAVQSFTGNFSDDLEVKTFTFTTQATPNFMAITFGYAGGTQANGNVVAAGGFDPSLALFDQAGNLVTQNDDADSTCGASVNTDPTTLGAFDACITIALAAGTYTLALTEYDNDAIGPTLAAGFYESDQTPADPSFTGAEFGCSNGQFCDVNSANRTSFYALDIHTDVPEPATLSLLGAGLLAFGAMRRRRAGTKAA